MTIGLPKAFLYYRYEYLWDTFFRQLGCEVIVSEDTNKNILAQGIHSSIDENCLSLKIYLGHVHALLGRCDYILVPRFATFGKREELCVRFLGLQDVVRNTYRDAKILQYNLHIEAHKTELAGFMRMGHFLGKKPARVYAAYQAAKRAQAFYDNEQIKKQSALLSGRGLKILIAAQPYIMHDCFTGGAITRIICKLGGIPLYSDRCERHICRKLSQQVAAGMYWAMNKETVGAIVLHKQDVDGVILLTSFPCGSDSLVNEMVLRKIKDVPVIQIVLDEQMSETGLQTRIESFMDILRQRERIYGE